MRDLIQLVSRWFYERNLNEGDPNQQMIKLREEVEELGSALAEEDHLGIIDGIGDSLVVLIGICVQLDLDIETCLDYAYNEIKDRRGKLINGIFVKEEDL